MSYPSLRSPSTPFVGRDAELAQVQQWLADPAHRLISLVELGRIGKTRLANDAAKTIPELLPRRGVFRAAAAAGTASPPTIAETALLGSPPRMDLHQPIAGFLDGKRRLLVLDGLEHLLPGVDADIDLLQSVPEVKFLITSREMLNSGDETLLHVGPLTYPEQGI
jgi:predicted ATPase